MDTVTDAEGSMRALSQAFLMIIASEIGDKTFLIAAILAMRHDRAVVFAGAFGSLLVMSILSAGMGRLLPSLIPKSWTQLAAAGLFLVFGVKMLFEAREMKGGSEKMQEEMREVEEEIEGDAVALEDMEEGVGRVGKRASIASLTGISGPDRSHNRSPPPRLTRAASFDKGRVTRVKESVRNFLQLLLGPVFVQSFIMTFLGEWGDRSQIATIALAAAHNVYLVTLGTVVGHACCTALAVIGGRWVSTKISIKHVTLGGAVLFLIFSGVYFLEAITTSMS